MVIVGGADEEAVVDKAFLACEGFLLAEGFPCDGLWLRIGHVQHGGHAACGCRAAFRFHVGLVREAGLAEVHVCIDHAGQQEAALGINDLVGRAGGRHIAVAHHGFHMMVLDEEGAYEAFALIDYRGIFYKCPLVHDNGFYRISFRPYFGEPTGFIFPRMAAQRSFTTPKSASPKIPPLILLVPSWRLTKMTGTSVTLKPNL